MKKRTVTPGGTPNRLTPENSLLPSGPTGRYLVVLRPESQKSLVKSLKDTAGLKAATSSDFDDASVSEGALGDADTLVLENISVAVVEAGPDQIKSLEMAVQDESNPVLSVEPESYVVALGEEESEFEEPGSGSSFLTAEGRGYLRGYSEAVQSLTHRLLGAAGEPGEAEADIAAYFSDTAALTWGLQATRVDKSSYSGAGIRIAVLDTGFDFNHPDFVGRNILRASFVPGQTPQDGHNHGTHCIGTACGPKAPAGTARRYGIAHACTILVGKVLNNAGSGMDGWILAGINWAIQNQAAVISMSLGAPVGLGGTFKNAYEQAALAALNRNCLIVAAAGNSGQSAQYYPVGSPANCPSIMAVGAVGNALQRAPFSCLGVNPNGGEVNIAAPGVNVYSSVQMPTRYGTMSGTSMATPHVAGIAGLIAQATGLRGKALWQRLATTAANIGQAPQAVGAGLVQAPVLRIKFPFPKVPLPLPHPEPIRPEPVPGRAEGVAQPALLDK